MPSKKAQKQPPQGPDLNHLEILRQGAKEWNTWRKLNPTVQVELCNADLRSADLREYNLQGARLLGAQLHNALLERADLRDADLTSAVLYRVTLTDAKFDHTRLTGSYLLEADVRGVDLSTADLKGADLSRVVASQETRWPAGVQPREVKPSPPTVWVPQGSVPTASRNAQSPVEAHNDVTNPPQQSENREQQQLERASSFSIIFEPFLTPEQIKGTLTALADYYRACGGLGLEIDFQLEEVLVRQPINVL